MNVNDDKDFNKPKELNITGKNSQEEKPILGTSEVKTKKNKDFDCQKVSHPNLKIMHAGIRM